jgi:hypothetical protein
LIQERAEWKAGNPREKETGRVQKERGLRRTHRSKRILRRRKEGENDGQVKCGLPPGAPQLLPFTRHKGHVRTLLFSKCIPFTLEQTPHGKNAVNKKKAPSSTTFPHLTLRGFFEWAQMTSPSASKYR